MVIAGAGDDFLPGALRALKWLVYKTGARIILSTEWRRKDTLVDAVNSVRRGALTADGSRCLWQQCKRRGSVGYGSTRNVPSG